jgi:outer membrane lipoprotein-sorting protein
VPALPVALLLLGVAGSARGEEPTEAIPQDMLADVLSRQADIAFDGKRDWTITGPTGRPDISYSQRVLHRPPADYRVEVISGLRRGDERHMLARGDQLYQWGRGTRVTLEESSDDYTLGLVVPREYLALLRENYRIDIRRGNPVAGRETYMLRITPRHEGRPSLRVWIDQKYGVPLRLERFDYSGRLEVRMQYRSITFQEDLPADLFELPEGARVVHLQRGTSFPGPEELAAETGLLAPVTESLPAGFRFNEVRVARRSGEPSVQSFYSDGYASFSIFAVPDSTEAPPGRGDPGLRRIESGRRGSTAYVSGWIGEVRITMLSSRLPEYELVRIFPTVRLSGTLPPPRFVPALEPDKGR